MPLSYSQLRRYRTCPRQFEFAHLKKIPWGISERESFGASVHTALKKWGDLEMIVQGSGKGKRKDTVQDDQLDLFVSEKKTVPLPVLSEQKLLALWHESFILDTYPTRFEADFARTRGEEIFRQYFAWWSKTPRSVLAVERGFTLNSEELSITGRLDRIEELPGGVRIVDYKTSPPCSQDEADADLQLSVYALAVEDIFGKPCRDLTLLFLSEEGVTELMTERRPSQLQDARTQIRLIRERMDAKDFRPTPGRAVCRRCPYRGVCDMAAV